MNTKEQYAAPELTLVGEARDIVLGWGAIGTDFLGDIDIVGLEFAPD